MQSAAVPIGPLRLTRTEAEQLAIKNNPRISVGRLVALAQHQTIVRLEPQNFQA